MINQQIKYEYTDNCYRAKSWLNNLPDLFAADFEVSGCYPRSYVENLKKTWIPTDDLSVNQYYFNNVIYANGLSFPQLTLITHLSVAWSDIDAKVIVCSSDKIRDLILSFLVSTNKTQIWHNIGYDGYQMYYNTGKLPKNFIDTQLLAKTILNDANSFRDRTGLKELMAYKYGEWAIAKDNFTLEDMWNPNMIKYSATDACATYALYQDIQKDLSSWKI